MMKWMVLAAGGALAFGLGAAPAHAGKGDDAWAACLWEQVPASADNWTRMAVPKRSYGLNATPPAYVLQFRLQAACRDRLTPAGKKRPPSFNAKSVHKALLATRPATIGADRIDPKAYRCELFFENDTAMKNPAGADWGYGDPAEKKYFFTMRYMFAANGGGSVGLADGGGLRRCRTISPEGGFVDA